MDSADYQTWWERQPQDEEPFYLGPNGCLDHMAACWLLYRDHIFFNDDEIAWDGRHHRLDGIQVNSANIDDAPVFLQNIQNYIQGQADFMIDVEQDEGLVIPRKLVAPGLHEALREGDVTGITLLNLQACGGALSIEQPIPNRYRVTVDPRVAHGLPDFHNLMGRLVWDMRAYNDIEDGFDLKVIIDPQPAADDFLLGETTSPRPQDARLRDITFTFCQRPVVTIPRATDTIQLW